MILCLIKCYLRGGETKVVILKEAVVIHTSWERDMFGHSCGLGNVYVLSVLKRDYWVILFLFQFCGHRAASSDVAVRENSLYSIRI